MAAASNSFTLSDYEAILEAASTNGYTFARFTDPALHAGERVLYLRHDVDNTLESALRMAEVENRSDAVATYLVMVRSENYNPFSRANVERLTRIRDLGHDIGLHFSAEEHDFVKPTEDLAGCIRTDAHLLEQVLGVPVRVFSFHNPTDDERFTADIPGLVNAYADPFFAGACYLSESNMRWPSGSPVEVLASGEHSVVQLLVHPLTYRADFRTDRDVLLWFLREKLRDLLALNVRQNRVLREQELSVAEIAAFLAKEDA